MKVQRQHPKGAQMNNLVTIYGGSGFVGRYIAQRMAKEGWRVRVAVRHPNEALFVKPYGAVGQVEPVLCNIRNDASVRAAAKGADVVVNCVGLLVQSGKNRFDVVQAEGAGAHCAHRPRRGCGAHGASVGHWSGRTVQKQICPIKGTGGGLSSSVLSASYDFATVGFVWQ